MFEVGQLIGKIVLVIFPLFIIYLLGVKDKKRLSIILLFVTGWILYVLPMELRPVFKTNHIVLFWLGIIPNFGCAFALPIIGLRNKKMTYDEARIKLLIYSLYTLGLLLAFELLSLIKGFGTFDWLDLVMSICGLTTLNIIFISYKTKFKRIFE